MRREKISADRRGLTLLGAAKHSVLLVVNYIGESSGGLRKTTSSAATLNAMKRGFSNAHNMVTPTSRTSR